MVHGRPITDFFKPPSKSRPNKRPNPSNETQERTAPKPYKRQATPDLQSVESKEPLWSKISHTVRLKSIRDTSPPAQSQEPPSPPPVLDPGSFKLRDEEYGVKASQTSVMTSNQRIVRNGEVMIRNSDDESDSDTSSLADLNTILEINPKREDFSPPEPDLPYLTAKSIPDESKEGDNRRRSARSRRQSPTKSEMPTKPNDRMSLAMLARQRKQMQNSKDEIARANSLLKIHKQQQEQARDKRITQPNGHDANLIETAMLDYGDEDGVGRLRTAIQRTEALNQDSTWSFFRDEQEEWPSLVSGFPSLKDDQQDTILSDTSSRQQAFLGGFVGEYAIKENLPEEILLWIMDTTCLEPREDLRNVYTSTLGSVPLFMTSYVTSERMDKLFQKVGASDDALDVESPVLPRPTISTKFGGAHRPRLLSLLAFLHGTAGFLSIKPRRHAICLLCRLILDHTVVHNRHIMSAIENAFSSLLDSVPPECYEIEVESILRVVYSSVDDITLRLQLLQNIPTFSLRSITLRRRLALAYFFDDTAYLTEAPDIVMDFNGIAARLQTPQFTVNNATDYKSLAAFSAILAVGIDAGDRPSHLSKDREKVFNENVDLLAARIRNMFTQIIDSGASNMKRTEAKEVLEGIHSRLLYMVRTKPPPKQMIFGDSRMLHAGEEKALRAFLNTGKLRGKVEEME